MSSPDFGQSAEDHRALLIVVRPVGTQLRQRSFMRVCERISRLTEFQIPNQQRVIHVRYKTNYPPDNNEWGDFQAHRKVLGVIGIGRCTNENELGDLFCQYDETKQPYSNTLFDSRLLVFGLNRDGTNIPHDQRQHSIDTPSEEKGFIPANTVSKPPNNGNVPEQTVKHPKQNNDISDNNYNKDSKTGNDFHDPLNANELLSSTKHIDSLVEEADNKAEDSNINLSTQREPNLSHVVFYPSVDDCADLEDKLKDFMASLFWVLESKRLDRSQERLEKLPLLMTPFERRDLVGIDTESRVYKKRCQGRLRKHLADLCLLAGLPGEALLHYQTCLDVLRSANDWLWLAAALEGACSASVVVTAPKVEQTAFNRNFSFSVKRGVAAINDPKLKAGGGKGMLSNGLDLADSRSKTVSLPSDLVDKYREAVSSYSKYKNAGIIEMEACIKATKVLISQQVGC